MFIKKNLELLQALKIFCKDFSTIQSMCNDYNSKIFEAGFHVAQAGHKFTVKYTITLNLIFLLPPPKNWNNKECTTMLSLDSDKDRTQGTLYARQDLFQLCYGLRP